MMVVIADDSAILRERLITLLADLPGAEVVGEATNAREAIELIRTHTPDAVVLDFQMPGGSGLETLRQVKGVRPTPIVIILTNFSSAEYRTACLKAGADFFFDKSYEFDKVRETVSDLM